MEDINLEEKQHDDLNVALGETEISATKNKRKAENSPEESLSPSTASPSRRKLEYKEILGSTSSEVDYCTKMMDEIKDLLNKIVSLENLKLPRDFEVVNNDILLHKSRIRDLIKDLDSSLASGKLPFDSKGEIDFTNVFCCKCPSKKVTTDNSFILCKGGCKRGFHESCLGKSPSTPYSGVISWICYGCNCKARCFDLLQKYHKTEFSTADSWEKVFPEAKEYRHPSSDSKDDDDYMSNEKKEQENVSPTMENDVLNTSQHLSTKESEKTELNSNPKNIADGGPKLTATKVDSAGTGTSEPTIISTSIFDNPLYSEHVQSSEFKDFEFKDENFDLPMDVKTKYRALCLSLKMLPHDNVPEKIHRDLVRGMIIQIIEIVDQIKASSLAIASLDDLQFWKTILEALATLGIDVGFLLARINNLMKHLSDYQANKIKRKILSSELEVQKQLHCEKLEEIKVIEASMDTLLGEFVDILPNNAKLNFEFSKNAKEGMGQ